MNALALSSALLEAQDAYGEAVAARDLHATRVRLAAIADKAKDALLAAVFEPEQRAPDGGSLFRAPSGRLLKRNAAVRAWLRDARDRARETACS